MRQFISSEFPNKQGLICLTGKDFRYLHQVLRLKSGNMLEVRFPDGTLQNTTVCKVEEKAKKITLQICAKTSDFSEKSLDVTRGVKSAEILSSDFDVEYYLFQFVAKPSKMEQIIRQAVECGIKFVIPVIGEYSQKQNILALENSKAERIERIIREARQQSGSPIQTEVLKPIDIEETINFWKKSCKSCDNSESSSQNVGVVLWERNEKTKTLAEVFENFNFESKNKKVAIVVGSEGGISPNEIETFFSAGFLPIHFKGNILRCETATLYGIAAVQQSIQIFNERAKSRE